LSVSVSRFLHQKCYHTLIHDINLSDKECIQYSFSKALGLAIVLGGSIVKVPQILKIVKARSARGLSLASFLLDSAGTGINVAYNIRKHFPWSTYGESVFLLVQNVSDRSRAGLHHLSAG
jgi:mannose-P-dolichol utilization defect protein 1